MTLRAVLSDLLDQGKAGLPTAGPQLSRPAWAKRVTGGGDVFLELDGDLSGLQLWEDSRGWGPDAELAVARGRRGDRRRHQPRAPGAFERAAWRRPTSRSAARRSESSPSS
jgi:hypothetical protein